MKHLLFWNCNNQAAIEQIMVDIHSEIFLSTNIPLSWSKQSVALWRKNVLHTDEDVGLRRGGILHVRIAWQDGT